MKKIKLFVFAVVLFAAAAAYADYNSCRCNLTAPGFTKPDGSSNNSAVCCPITDSLWANNNKQTCCELAGKQWISSTGSCADKCTGNIYTFQTNIVLVGGGTPDAFLDTCDSNVNTEFKCALTPKTCTDISLVSTTDGTYDPGGTETVTNYETGSGGGTGGTGNNGALAGMNDTLTTPLPPTTTLERPSDGALGTSTFKNVRVQCCAPGVTGDVYKNASSIYDQFDTSISGQLDTSTIKIQ